MTKRRFQKLTPLEKAQENAYNFAFNMYEALLVNVYMTSGSFDQADELSKVTDLPSNNISSGSQTSSGHQAA
jgi:hypothetical protein